MEVALGCATHYVVMFVFSCAIGNRAQTSDISALFAVNTAYQLNPASTCVCANNIDDFETNEVIFLFIYKIFTLIMKKKEIYYNKLNIITRKIII